MSKRQELREKRAKQQQNQNLMIGGFIILGALLLAFFLIGPVIADMINPPPPPKAIELKPRPQAVDNAMGDPNAPIKIVEYSDYQCPFCKQFSDNVEPQLVENLVKTGKVHFTYRSMGNFVSDNINRGMSTQNTESIDAAKAAYCAGDQGKYWEYHDIIFANHDGENEGAFKPSRLTAFAQTLGLDMSAFNACVNSNKHQQRAQKDYTDGTAAGVNGTPSFVMTYIVNGETKTEFIEGAQPYQVFEQKVNAALQEMGLQP